MSGKQISAGELHTVLSEGLPDDSILIDVRSPEECARGMIAGARNIPVEEIAAHQEELARFKKVYLYCLSGSRSEMASALLMSAGFGGETVSLTSGLLAWRNSGYTV